MSVVVTALAVQIATGLTTGAGHNRGTEAQAAIGLNGIYDPASGALYAVALDTGTDALSVLRSLDGGATWALYSGPQASSSRVEFISAVLVAGVLWVAYATGTANNLIYCRSFTLTTATWGAEVSMDVSGAPFFLLTPEGPFTGYTLPSGLILWFFRSLAEVPAYVFFCVFDPATGLWSDLLHGAPVPYPVLGQTYPAPATGDNPSFCGSIVGADSTAHLIISSNFLPPIYYVEISPLGAVAAPVDVTGPDLICWNSGIVGTGVIDNLTGNLYYPVSLKTADYPTIYGNVGMLARVAGIWSYSPVLDPSALYSVLQTPAMLLLNGQLIVAYLQYDGGRPGNYKLRLGYTALANWATPAAWTWTDAYDFSVPAPAIPGAIAPYAPLQYGGITTSMDLNATTPGQFRILQVVQDSAGTVYVVYLVSGSAGSPGPVALTPVFQVLNMQSAPVTVLPDPRTICGPRIAAKEFQCDKKGKQCPTT